MKNETEKNIVRKPVKKAKTGAKQTEKKTGPKTTKPAKKGNLEKLGKNSKFNNAENALDFPNEAIIDLRSYDWEGEKLTDAQKLFIIWFSTPGTEYYHRASRAALKAGYSPKTAKAESYKMRLDPKIDRFIKKIENTIVKLNTIDVAQRWIQEKITRGDYKVKDFYETVEYVNEKTGEPVKKLALKKIEDLSEDQLLCIDGIDVKGQQGTMIYTLPDREKVRDSLISLVQKMDQGNKDDEEDEPIEIIVERLIVKRMARQAKDDISQSAGLFRIPKNAITEL